MSSDESDSDQSGSEESEAASSAGENSNEMEVDEPNTLAKPNRHVVPGTNIRAVCCHMDDVAIRLRTLFSSAKGTIQIGNGITQAVDKEEEKVSDLAVSLPVKSKINSKKDYRNSRTVSPQKKRQRLSKSPRMTDDPSDFSPRSIHRSTRKPEHYSSPSSEMEIDGNNSIRSRSIISNEGKNLVTGKNQKERLKSAIHGVTLSHYIKRKREMNQMNSETKAPDLPKKTLKFESFVKRNRGAFKYVDKMKEEKEALQRTHAEELHDMHVLLNKKEEQLHKEKKQLEQSIIELENMPEKLKAKYATELEDTKKSLKQQMEALKEEQRHVQESLKEESDAALALQKEELAVRHLEELRAKDERMAEREAALLSEKEQLESQIQNSDTAHKLDLEHLQDQLNNTEIELAKRRKIIADNIEKQMELSRNAKRQRRNSIGVIGKFLRLRSKTATWGKLRDDANMERMVAEAKDAMAKEVKQEHRKHMEAYGVEEDDDDTENDDPFFGADDGGDQTMADDEEEDATLALHRQKHVEEKKQNEKNRKDLGKKMIAIKNAMKVFKSDQKKIEEQMIAVEERVEQSESEAEKQELEKLHKDLSNKQDALVASTTASKKELSSLGKNVNNLEAEFKEKFSRPVQRLRAAIHVGGGAIKAVAAVAVLRRKVVRKKEEEKLEKIRMLDFKAEDKKKKLEQLQVDSERLADALKDEEVDEEKREELDQQRNDILEQEEIVQKEISDMIQKKDKEEKELEMLEEQRLKKELLGINRLRAIVKKNSRAIKCIADITEERDGYRNRLVEMKEDLELQQHELENERLEVKEQYQNAMKEQNIAQQTQLSKLKEEITEKEKLLEQKEEMLKLEMQLDHSDRLFFQKDKASKEKINTLEEQLKTIMENEDLLNEHYAKVQKERVRIARIAVASTRRKREIESTNEIRNLSKKKKENMKRKLDVEKKLEKEIEKLKQMQQRENRVLDDEIKQLEQQLEQGNQLSKEIQENVKGAYDQEEASAYEIDLQNQEQENHKFEIRILKLRDRLIRRQNVDSAEKTLRRNAQNGRKILDNIERLQNKIDSLEVAIEKGMTQIEVEKRDMGNATGEEAEHYAVHIQHLDEVREDSIKEVEELRTKRDELLLQALRESHDVLHKVAGNAKEYDIAKQKDELQTLLAHVEEKEHILEEDEELLRIDRLEAVRQRLPLEIYEQLASQIELRKKRLEEERETLESEMDILYTKIKMANDAKVAREQTAIEMKVSKDMVSNATQKQMAKVKQLEVDHLKLAKEEKKLEKADENLKILEQTLITMSPDQRTIKEQEVAQKRVEIQTKRADLQAKKNELDTRASDVIKNVEALGAGQLVRQKQGILTTFLRSLDSERYILEMKEDALRDNIYELSRQNTPGAKNQIESLNIKIKEIDNEKEKLNKFAEEVIRCLEEERDTNEKTRIAAVDEMERQQLEALEADIAERMKIIEKEMTNDIDHEFTKKELTISESVTSLLSNISNALEGQNAIDDVSDEAWNIVSDTQDERRTLRATHEEHMSELHAMAEDTKLSLRDKLEKMKRQRKTLANQVKKAQNSNDADSQYAIQDLEKQAVKLDNEIKVSSIESHRIDLDLRESEREKRERLREDEMAANEKLKGGLERLEGVLTKASSSLEEQRNEAKSAKRQIEMQIKQELRDAISSLKKTYANKIGEEEENTAIQEKQIKSEIAHNNDLIIIAPDEKALELKKKQSVLNGKLEVLVSKQIELSKLRMNSEQAINDQAARHEANIREKYQNRLTEVEERIKHTEIRLEREKKKLEQSQDAALKEESLLLKSRKLDFEESEKDKEALSTVEKMEALEATDPQLSVLNNKVSEVHSSTASLKEMREKLSSAQNASIEIDEEAIDADIFPGMEGDESMPPEEDNDPFSNMDRMGGDEAVPDEVDENTKDTVPRQKVAVQNVPSEEQIKAEEAANAEIAKIKLQNESNDAEIDNLKKKLEEMELKHQKERQAAEEEQEKEILKVTHDAKLKEISTKIKSALIVKAKLSKQYDEYQEMAKELKKERKQIRNLKMNNALLHLKINKRPTPSTTAKDRINAKPGENIGEKSSRSKVQVVKMAQEKKFNQEKEKSKRIEAEAIEESEDKMRASLAAIEQDRQQLEEKRDVAIQQIAEVVKEKESQRELIGEKRASKNSLRPLVLKQMKYLKAKEAFELQLQTLKMKKEKAEADHAAEVVRAQQHTRKSMSKLVRKNRKILTAMIKLNREREENEMLKKKIQDDQEKEKQKAAAKKKNRFSGLMKKHKKQLVTNAKKERQLLAFREGLESAREKRELDRATAEQLRNQLEQEKERFKKRSWIRVPDRSEILSAIIIQSWVRGCKVRHQMPKYRKEKAIADGRRNAAARMIQKNWRGVLGRQKALFRQKLADMGMVYQWKREQDNQGSNIDEDIGGVGVNTEPTLLTKDNNMKDSTNQMLLTAGLSNVKKHQLNAPDSLMSTARSSKSDLSQDSIEEIKGPRMRYEKSGTSGDLYRYTAKAKGATSRQATYIDDENSLAQQHQLTPYSNSPMYPKKRDDLINQAIGILVGNEQY